MTAVDVVVMAAGQGTRMKSGLPKVLHRLGGKPLVQHVLDSVAQLEARRVVVVTGHQAGQVKEVLTALAQKAGRPAPTFVVQEPQNGTGHAVQQAAPQLPDDGVTLILNGDVPLIAPETLRALVAQCEARRLALLSVQMPDPTGYGRIVRDGKGRAAGIVEHKDASDEQRAIREVYTGFMAAPTAPLKRWLAGLTNDNAQKEYYLTDVVKAAVAEGTEVVAVAAGDAVEVQGINDALELAAVDRAWQLRRAAALMKAGVRIADPARFDLRGELVVPPAAPVDVEIDVGCVFEGRVELGAGVRIGAYCVISDAKIEAGAVIHPFTHIQGEAAGVRVGAGALVGPYARLRPGADLGQDVHIGNFVEVKNARLAAGAKANHLAYLGDADVGERVNYGAGSITANYDGANKHRTVIGADVHVGSNCVLVAPVNVGAGGTVGAGSVVSKDTPPGALTVARARQVSIEKWQRPRKAPK